MLSIILVNSYFPLFLFKPVLLKSIKLKRSIIDLYCDNGSWDTNSTSYFCTVISLAAEECYSDVLQQARTAVEKDGVKEKLMNEITVREGAATEATRTLTVSNFILVTPHIFYNFVED